MRSTRPPQREDLHAAIAHEEMRLERLGAEQTEARTRLAALREELAALGITPECHAGLPANPRSFALGSDILPGSAAQDAGDSSAVPLSLGSDLDERPRIVAGAVDIGAYEVPEPGAALAGAAPHAARRRARG